MTRCRWRTRAVCPPMSGAWLGEGGKRGPAGPGVGCPRQPGGGALVVERRADELVVQFRLREADVSGAAQVAAADALRDRPLDAGPRGVPRRELRRALPAPRGLQRLILLAAADPQHPLAPAGDALRPCRAGPAVGQAEADEGDGVPVRVGGLLPGHARLALRAG